MQRASDLDWGVGWDEWTFNRDRDRARSVIVYHQLADDEGEEPSTESLHSRIRRGLLGQDFYERSQSVLMTARRNVCRRTARLHRTVDFELPCERRYAFL